MISKAVVVAMAGAVAGLLAVIGCSGQGPADEPHETLERMLGAVAIGQYEDACRLTADSEGRVDGGARLEACAEDLRVYAEGVGYRTLRSLRDVSVQDTRTDEDAVAISGDHIAGAPAAFREGVFEMVRIDDRWYVSGS